MPRKPLPPPPIFRIEGLSDGIDRRLVDDWSGLPLETTARPVVIPNTVNRRMSAADGKAILQLIGMLPLPKETVAVVAKPPAILGKRAIVGEAMVMYVPQPSWRRV
jgi:hypothetical protein